MTDIRFRLKQVRRKITYSDSFIGLLASLTVFIIILYVKTLRIRTFFHPDFLKLDPTKVIFGFWHGRQFLLIPSFGDWNISIMTDISWAGDIQTKILKRFGYAVVRGSSKRKGVRALLYMKRAMEDGSAAVFALDGPSGPIYESKPGILFLAEKMGYPVVPVTTTADRAWILKQTWCRYLLPKPFSRCYVAIGKPLYCTTPKNGLTTKELDRIMLEWMAEGDMRVGRPSDDVFHR